MTPFKLEGTSPTGKHVEIWCCGACGAIRHAEYSAERCCQPLFCRAGCGAVVGYYGECHACQKVRIRKEESEAYEKAEKIPVADYDEEHVCLVGGDYRTVEDVLDDEEEDRPEWAWAVDYLGVPRIDAYETMLNMLEESYEDAIEDLDIGDLQARIDEWIEKQNFTSYIEDRTRVVVFKKEEEDDDLDEAEEGATE